jgi:hypothetical protein
LFMTLSLGEIRHGGGLCGIAEDPEKKGA